MAAGPQAPAAQRGARTTPTRPQGQGILLPSKQALMIAILGVHTRTTLSTTIARHHAPDARGLRKIVRERTGHDFVRYYVR
eukprot:1779248-Pyramimonas_sp.AAC.1